MAPMSSASPQTLVHVGSKAFEEKPKPTALAAWCSVNWKLLLSEFLSTFMLVFFGCMSCIAAERSPFYAPVGFGLIVMINLQIFGHISMAHMNPAITLTGVIWGNTSVVLGICYSIAQILGAMVGYGLLISLSPIDLVGGGICVTRTHVDLHVFQSLGIEIILTGVLSLLNCGVWDPINTHKQDSVPIKFGLAIIGLSTIGGPLTDASMNPARSFGPALWTGVWTDHWIYWAGPFIGAGVTAICYKFVFLRNKDKEYLVMKLM